MREFILLIGLAGFGLPAYAETPADFLSGYAAQAKQGNQAYAQSSADRGKQFFQTTHGKEWSCASCHTNTPTQSGRHRVTDRTIEPLAPAANPLRFTSAKKVEKWFKRNCGDVLGRECSAAEKADVVAYLVSLK